MTRRTLVLLLWSLFVLPALALAAEPDIPARLAAMSLEDKVGQLFLIHFPGQAYDGEVRQWVEQRRVGGVILYSAAGNIGGFPAEVALLTARLRAGAKAAGLPPLFIGVDQEGGRVARLRKGFTLWPSQMAEAAARLGGWSDGPPLAAAIAGQAAAVGANLTFAPVLDVNVNPANPIIDTRAYGAEPSQVARLGRAAVEAMTAQGRALACVKHFPGHGDTTVDSHRDLPLLAQDRQRLDTVELVPFRVAVAARVPMVMSAHVAVPALTGQEGLPATLSRAVLTDLLRGQMGFAGVVVTDSLLMGAIRRHFGVAEAALRACLAGADVLLFGADLYGEGRPEEGLRLQREAYDLLLAAARDGRLPRQRLDEAVGRILRAKALLPPPSSPASFDWQAEERLAATVAGQAVTLLARSGHVPVAAQRSLVVIHPPAATLLGEVLRRLHPGTQTLSVGLDPSADDIHKATVLAAKAEVVVVGTQDVARHPAQIRLVQALAPRSPLVAAVESPYDFAHLPPVAAMLATYGTQPAALEALAEVLTGVRQPTGRLPVSLRLPDGTVVP